MGLYVGSKVYLTHTKSYTEAQPQQELSELPHSHFSLLQGGQASEEVSQPQSEANPCVLVLPR